MNTSLTIFVLLALTGAMLVQDESNRPSKPLQADAEGPAALVEHLALRAKHLPGFSAKYHGVSKGDPFDLRLVYRAPDSARFDLVSGGGTMSTWILDGHAFVRGDGAEMAFASDLDFKKAFEGNSGFQKVLEAEFPPPDGYDFTPGLIFRLWPASAKERDKSFNFSLNWYTPRPSLLDWLAHSKSWASAKQVDGNLVRELEDGSWVALSLSTGFIASITRPDGAHLELTDFSESVEEVDFVIPEPKPGAKDEMAKAKAGLPALADFLRRAVIYQRMSYEKDTTSEAFQSKLAKVFDALFAPNAAVWHASLVESWGTYVDSFVTWAHDRFKQTAGDAAATETLRQQIAERRAYYDHEMERILQGHALEMRGFEELGLTQELIDRVHAVERETLETVGRREAAEPFLAKFDAAIAAAESGR